MPGANWYFLPNQVTLIKYSMWGKVRFVDVLCNYQKKRTSGSGTFETLKAVKSMPSRILLVHPGYVLLVC